MREIGKTAELLGSGQTADVYALEGDASLVAWVPFEYSVIARFSVHLSRVQRAGHSVHSGTVWIDDSIRACLFYPRCTVCVSEVSGDDLERLLKMIDVWIQKLKRVGLYTLHISPKHILKHPTRGYVLTGLAHVFDPMSPPSAILFEYGPYCPVGDSPLCFFNSMSLEHIDVLTLLMDHSVAVCCTLLVEGMAANIVASAEFSSTSSQIKLSLSDHDDPASVAVCLQAICAKPIHRAVSAKLLRDALARLAPNRRCCSVL